MVARGVNGGRTTFVSSATTPETGSVRTLVLWSTNMQQAGVSWGGRSVVSSFARQQRARARTPTLEGRSGGRAAQQEAGRRGG